MAESSHQSPSPVSPGREELGIVRAGRLATYRVFWLGGAFLLCLGIWHRLFFDFFLRWIYAYPIFFLLGAILVLSVYNLILRGMGVWRLFLHERFWPRFFSACGAAVVAGQLMAATFLVEKRFHKLSNGRVTNEDATYLVVAEHLQPILKSLGLHEWFWTFQHQPGDHASSAGGFSWNEYWPRIGRSTATRYASVDSIFALASAAAGGLAEGLHDDPEDFGSRWITFTFVTAAPIWLLLAVPGLPLRPFEGRRFTPPKVPAAAGSSPEEVTELPEAAGDLLVLTPGWRLRLIGWFGGLLAGMVFLYASIYVGIPITGALAKIYQGLDQTYRDGDLALALTNIWNARPGASPETVYFFARLMFILVGVGVFFLLRVPKFYRIVSPGLAIAALLWILIHVFGFYHMLERAEVKLVGTLALIVYLTYSNGSSYKMMIPGLESWYHRPARPPRNLPDDESRPQSTGQEAAGATQAFAGNGATHRDGLPSHGYLKLNESSTLSSLQTPPADQSEAPGHEQILKRWYEKTREEKPKLAIVCVSGGALRSAIWTAVVLDAIRKRLEQKRVDFDCHLRLITGASGGMLGAAAYVSRLYYQQTGAQGSPYTGDGLADNLKEVDSLTDVARRMALYDLTSIFDPRVQWNDRGRVLEETWRELLPWTFANLGELELPGTIPSIIFAPMLVEDGRRVLISNLDLGFLTKTRGPILVDPDSYRLYGPHLSQEALELRTMFPGKFPGFLLRTAVRLNASFPYVSPAVSLPTEPPRSPVDAGYYDNFGVNIACRWIHKHRDWLVEHTSGIVMIQVRDHLGQRDRFEFTDDVGFLSPINRAVSFLTAPLSGANKARYATTSFRNDEQIQELDRLLNEPDKDQFFRTVIFEFQNDGEVALNWQLSQEEVRQLQAGMGLAKNQDRLERLIEWWTGPEMDGRSPQVQPTPSAATTGEECLLSAAV